MTSARVKLVNVRLKAGGASLHVLPQVERGVALSYMRDWVERTADLGEPDAWFAVAWHRDGPSWATTTDYYTSTCALPVVLLPVLAEESMRRAITIKGAEMSVMDNLGYVLNDPDDAS